MVGWKLVQIYFLLSLLDIQTATETEVQGLTGTYRSKHTDLAHRKQLMRCIFGKNLMDISTNQML